MSQPPSLEELLSRWRAGDPAALDAVVEDLYRVLHARVSSILRHQRSRSIQTTELLHEVYLKLREITAPKVSSPEHFMNTAARIVRNVLVDKARELEAQKRGAGGEHVVLTTALGLVAEHPGEEQMLDALTVNTVLERIAQYAPEIVVHIELRIFLEMTESEIVQAQDSNRTAVQREWALAKRVLLRELSGTSGKGEKK